MNVSLSKQQRAYIEHKVKSGRYGSNSEVVREALRVLEELELDREALEQALDEADLEPAIKVKDHKKWWKAFKDELHRDHAKRQKKSAA